MSYELAIHEKWKMDPNIQEMSMDSAGVNFYAYFSKL